MTFHLSTHPNFNMSSICIQESAECSPYLPSIDGVAGGVALVQGSQISCLQPSELASASPRAGSVGTRLVLLMELKSLQCRNLIPAINTMKIAYCLAF